MITSRAMTREEMVNAYLDQIDASVRYWLSRGDSPRELAYGIVFSMLVLLDGESGLPGCDVIPHPHPDDMAHYKAAGDNWIPVGIDICDGELHSRWAQRRAKNETVDAGRRSVPT